MTNKLNNSQEGQWYCPLLGDQIAEGECLDVNYERLGYVQGCALDKMEKITCKSTKEINDTCESCPNMPLK